MDALNLFLNFENDILEFCGGENFGGKLCKIIFGIFAGNFGRDILGKNFAENLGGRFSVILRGIG